MRIKILPAFLALSFVLLSSPIFAVGKPSGLPIQAQNHLTEAKLKACQARENGIRQRSTRLVDLVTNTETKFETIAKRVEDYYTNKQVPSGKIVSNYNNLTSDIQDKKTAVQVALIKVHQYEALNFSCSASDPKAQMSQFRTDMQTVKKTLQDFRISIKNLIVAVHSVTGETERANPSVSPKPTK
ncbi:hypothetical protein HY031_00635 [Candidatus Gottesmanbacteria bacterium]|nr:hypothetical protein [Candidatus Gottesmanbacteria bacterium]